MSNKDYRAKLLEAAAALGAEEARRTPEDQLQRIVIHGLGLPGGTALTDEQWDMVLKAHGPHPASLGATDRLTGQLDGLALPGGLTNG